MKSSAIFLLAMISLAHAQQDPHAGHSMPSKSDALAKAKKVNDDKPSTTRKDALAEMQQNGQMSATQVTDLINKIKQRKQERKAQREKEQLAGGTKGKDALGNDEECDEEDDKKPRPTPTPMPYADAASPVKTPTPTPMPSADSDSIVSGSVAISSISSTASLFAILAVFLI